MPKKQTSKSKRKQSTSKSRAVSEREPQAASGIGADERCPWVKVVAEDDDAPKKRRVRVRELESIVSRPQFKRKRTIAGKALKKLLPQWRRRKGFQGASVGFRVDKQGRPTGDVCIRIFVEKVIPADELHSNQAFPDTVSGVKVQVVAGTFSPMDGTTEDLSLDGGDLIIPAHRDNTGGTIGVVGRDPKVKQARYITAAHVVLAGVPPSQVSTITDTSMLDADREQIGQMIKSKVRYSGEVDCASVKPVPPIPKSHTLIIKGFNGYPTGIRTTPPVKGERVRMFSRRKQRVTGGTVTDIHFTAPMTNGITLQEQFLIKPDDGTVFGQGGDSGSLVVDGTGKAIGLFIAVMINPATGKPRSDGLVAASRFVTVCSKLQLELYSATTG